LSPTDPPRGVWAPLALTLAIQAMVSLALLTLPVMAPEVARSLQISAVWVGAYISVSYVGAIVSSLLGGTASRRWGAIRVSQWGLVLCALGLLLCTVPWLPAMALGALLIGLGYGPITPASSHVLARTTPAHRMSLVFSVKQTGVPAGSMLAGAVVPSVTLALHWQASLVLVALACAACALASQPLRAHLDADRLESAPAGSSGPLASLRLVFSHSALATLAACSFLFCMVQMSLTTHLVTFLHQELAYSLVGAGMLLAFAQMGGVGGRIAWGYLADRWLGSPRMLILLAALMAACALVTLALSPTTPRPLVVLLLVVFGASAIGWNGVYLAEVARRAPPGLAGVATGGTLACTFMGVVIGPFLFGLLSEILGTYRAGFAVLAAVALVGGSLLLAMVLRSRPGAASSVPQP
jgi:predicted MFS family arabinose efflux permease